MGIHRNSQMEPSNVRASELLGKAVGMFADRPTVAVQVNQYSDIELARWIAHKLRVGAASKQIEAIASSQRTPMGGG